MVDLPEPDSPTSATEEFLGTLKETPLSAELRPSYEKLTFSRKPFEMRDYSESCRTDQIQSRHSQR